MDTDVLCQLQKLSYTKRELPEIHKVRAVHVYNFDSTIFLSPVPNPRLWTEDAIAHLQSDSCFASGGWRRDVHFLEATGRGVAAEEKRAWADWWNEDVVQVVRWSMHERRVLTVLLADRDEQSHGPLILRMCSAKGLDFDMLCLEPKGIKATGNHKRDVVKSAISAYEEAVELMIFDADLGQVHVFCEMLNEVNRCRQKKIKNKIHHVSAPVEYVCLDPLDEVQGVQQMIYSHNQEALLYSRNNLRRMVMCRHIICIGYLLRQEDSLRLQSLVDVIGQSSERKGEYKIFADSVTIDIKAVTAEFLDKIGGMHKEQWWKVEAKGACCENRLFAARVVPVPDSSHVATFTDPPSIVIACKKGTSTKEVSRIREEDWEPLPAEKQFLIRTTIGEKDRFSISVVRGGEKYRWQLIQPK